MKAIDFSRTFLTFRIDAVKKPPQTVTHKLVVTLNNARIPLESHCVITEKSTGHVQTFAHGTSCKTERVGVEQDIWTEPNADFIPIFTADRYLTLKTYAKCGMGVPLYPPGSGVQSDRQTGRIDSTFDNVRIDITERPGEVLESPQEIVHAVLKNEILVARTELENDRYRAVIEYPVKTINASEREWVYQTDTGPMLIPDLTAEPDLLLDGMQLAFSALNSPDWIEFLIRVPTDVGNDVSVYHYSRSLHVACKNQIIRLP
ncbi:MAG: hypothetical protein O2955_03580 [Planctomycetota bacterium]|nr:hypothetical protein [Planctomycetota bacterium]MDA1211569.1 hypothetical protein [Planctomycetota bacterium]